MLQNYSFLKKFMQAGAVVLAVGSGALLGQTAEELRLTLGKSVVIDYPTDVKQISTTSPEVLDYTAISTREILLNAKGVGNSTLIVWSKTGQRTFYHVNVELTGIASTKEVSDRAAALAAGSAKAVINNLAIKDAPPDKQILLRVKFAELDREKERQFGINLLGSLGNNAVGSTTGQFPAPTFNGTLTIPSAAAGASSVSSSAGTAGAGGSSSGGVSSSATGNNGTFSISQVMNLFIMDPHLNVGAFIKALENENLLEILAEPNLVASNGKEASFLVGGEFPVPILQGGGNSGAVTVQFKQFGIKLRFTPEVTPNNTIKLHLMQEVSTIDTSNAVVLNGFSIQALSSRQTETNVELGEGQSFIVAGLLSNQEQNQLSKIPWIGSLPILGNLFKTKDDKVQRQELIMMVTPEITMPLGPNDPKPEPYFPKDFLKRLDPKDIPQEKNTTAKASKKK
jgi:pilus assembly protein CpaC